MQLKNLALKTEGLFRLSGGAAEIEKLKKAFEESKLEEKKNQQLILIIFSN